MEEVRAWLTSNGLGAYWHRFEENGWDEMSLLEDMTENELEACIQKAGHRARFRKALRTFRLESAVPTKSRSDLLPDTFTAGMVSAPLNKRIRTGSSAALSDASHPITLSLQAGQSRAITLTTPSEGGPHCATKETTVYGEDGYTVSKSRISSASKDVSTVLTFDEDMIPCTPDDRTSVETERVPISLEMAEIDTNEDEMAVSMDFENYQPLVLSNAAQQTSNLMCGTPFNLTIIEHSEHTTVAEAKQQIIGESERSANPVEILKEQMEMIANSFELKDHLYVETKAFQELNTIIDTAKGQSLCWATVLGKPGDGKSSTAAHLMLKYRDRGYEPIFVSCPQDWKMLISINSNAKQFVIIDDMFGTSYTDSRKVDEWLSMIENMERIVNGKKSNLVVVCTSRRYVFTDVESALSKFACFRKMSIVDMTHKTNQLSRDEKLLIFNKFAEAYNLTVDEKSLEKIKRMDPPHGFPHCVELFCTNAFLRQDGLSFFENPTKCVQTEIHNIKDNDPFKFFVLLLMLLRKRLIGSSYLAKLISNPSEDEAKLFKATGLSIDTAYPGLVKAVESLTNTYLRQETDGSYSFTHESLKENVAVVYISVNPVHATELLSFQQVVTYTNLDKTTTAADRYSELPAVQLPLDILVEQITKEIISGDASSASKCNVWNDENFVNEWVRYVTCDYNIPACLMSVILKKIFCSKGKGHQLRRTNILANLLKNKMNGAVKTLLENKFLLERIKRYPVWFEVLQTVLDTASTYCLANFDVVKSILKCHGEENGKKLNGSYCLVEALRQSHPECAKLMLAETVIKPEHGSYSGGYFHYLVNSIIVSDDFDTLCSSLLEVGANINQMEMGTNLPPLFRCILKSNMQNTDLDRLGCLVSKGANINATVSPSNRNIVCFAIENLSSEKCLHVLPKLYELGANFQCVKNDKMNALHALCTKPSGSHGLDVLNYLIDMGVSASQCNGNGEVPLMFALRNDPGIDTIRRLLELCPPNHTNIFGQGYFHYLFRSKCNLDHFRSYCNLLLESGEDINLPDSEGKPPVFIFCEKALENTRDADETTGLLQFLQSVKVSFQE